MSIIWTIIIGFVAGIIAKLIAPGPNNPSGFILTTILGIVGAFLATYLGQAIGWYQAAKGRAHRRHRRGRDRPRHPGPARRTRSRHGL